MNSLKFIDATLRDGSHLIKHNFDKDQIKNYCKNIDDAGMYSVIVGHGYGLGASSLQAGLSKLSDYEMLSTAKENLKRTKLGVYMVPGFGTINDLKSSIEIGVEVFKIGSQCTEANTTKQHIQYLSKQNKEVYGILMMYHITDTESLVKEAKKMESYGANGIIIMDSAGASTPELVKKTICNLKESLNIQIGFHAHNNLGLAVSNTYLAIKEGANIIDGTVRGFGAGAGNCQLEAIIALLKKEEYSLENINLYKILDVSRDIVSKFSNFDNGIDDISIISGMAGVFSGFKNSVIRISKEFNIDARDIFIELGKRKAMAGQEDMIFSIISSLKNKKN